MNIQQIIKFLKSYYIDIIVIAILILGWSLYLNSILFTIPETKKERDTFKQKYDLAINDHNKYELEIKQFKNDIEQLNRFIEDSNSNIENYEKKINALNYIIYKNKKELNSININKLPLPIKKKYTNEELENRIIKDYFTKSDTINN